MSADEEIFPFIPDPPDGTPWRAPAALEERLYELARRNDAGDDRAAYEYLRVISAEGLYRPVPLAGARQDAPVFVATPADGRRIVQAYTAGVLPRPHPEVAYEFVTLGDLGMLWPDDVDVLVVNAATPCEASFLSDEEEREIWAELRDELFRPGELCDRVETRRTGAPEGEAMLRGLACGAHLCYANGDAWNTLDWHGAGYSGEVRRLAEAWGIDDRDDWSGTQERLLAGEVSPWLWQFTLDGRNWLVREAGQADPALWRDSVEETVRRHVDEDVDALVKGLRDLVGQIMRYEARFRADGLLPPGGYVRSVAAWDLGRATMVARWGRGARYASEAEMRDAIERAGRSAQTVYGSWAEFSAGYVLGRCLHFDEETFGEWYTDVLAAHRVLMSHPESPWLSVSLP
ncbi:DUF1266 domain-containing protein [Nonomuraea sp. SBT364]|uniref:DUF1266 domain-containing protein n=1 Tax=Nonomuraea sp. SBT364 TaxID=1580530 RepID=UPI0007C76C08|nr:DUF1266 domain-containing protein [Nonomuraea sp. SBT364]